MLSKIEILVVIFVLLLTFYFVISWGASKKGKSPQSPKVSNYLFNVRILIIFIGQALLQVQKYYPTMPESCEIFYF